MASLMDEISEMTGDEDVEVVEEKEEEVSAAALTAAVEDAPVVKMLNAILMDAVKRGLATDELLREAGYSEDEIRALREAKAAG